MSDKENSVRGLKLVCLRCNHSWYPRIPTKPMCCPNCKNRRWDISKNKGSEK